MKGQILVLAIVVIGVVMVSVMVIISGSLTFFQDTNYSLQSVQATNLAEAGVDKAIASLNVTSGAYNGEVETFIGNGSFGVTVTPKEDSIRVINVTGYIPNKTSLKVKRTIQVEASTSKSISFAYGLMAGGGGISMGSNSKINGAIYANGNVYGGNNETINGDVYIAGGVQPSPDQQNDCISPGCDDFIFGRNVGGNSRLSVAQSFTPGTTAVLNKVSLKLKKIGLPKDLTVRVLADREGIPDKNQVLATGTLPQTLVTDQYEFVDISFDVLPNLSAGTTYWIMAAVLEPDDSDYWAWSEDTLQSYMKGTSAWSSEWFAKFPYWTTINADLGFKTWVGGTVTSLAMESGSVINGTVRANTISGVTINKDAYYQVIKNSVVHGRSYPNSSDPLPVTVPIPSSDISSWQADAEGNGVRTGNIQGCPVTLGPEKIQGNVTISNNCTVTIRTPIWITGNLSFGNSSIFKMNSGLGNYSGVVIVDGTAIFQNSDNLIGTGASKSSLILISTYNSQTQGGVAIDTGNSSIAGILYAPFGTINLANNATFRVIMASQINVGNNTTLNYNSDLNSVVFPAGSSGSYSMIKGTYQLK